ncbi:MAG TPA: ROK family protein, partial [Gemmatimonadales bacterium]|nr:ROK family protein [Gemmatimonadales bacterium]
MRVAGAVDIGGTRTKIGIVAARGRIVRRTAIPTPGRDPRALVDAIGTALRPLLAQTASGDLAPVIGVSVAGFLDPARSAMIANANLPALCGFPLRRALEDRLGRECRLEVD